jgi:hypothetical protein
MSKERIIGSYLLRFTEVKQEKHFYLQDLRTGEIIEFESWVSAWAFLEQELYPSPNLPRKAWP